MDKAKRFTAEQKLEVIKKVVDGQLSVYSVCRQYQISKVTLYKWLSLYRRSRKNRLSALSSKILSGSKHPKGLTYEQKQGILSLVHKNPRYSCHQIAKILGLGNHGVQNFLEDQNLSFEIQRVDFSQRPFWKRETSDRREGMMSLYERGWRVKDICRHFNVSKPTFIKWRKRYDSAGVGDKQNVLKDRYVAGESHHKSLSSDIEKNVIDIVGHEPSLSVHGLHLRLASEVGHHGIQNILNRSDLSTYEKRLRFAQSLVQEPRIKVASLYQPEIPLWRLRILLAPFVTVPKLLLTEFRKGLFVAAVSFLPLFIFFFWIRFLFTASQGLSVAGLFFASISLTFGIFFFIYSLKYYITILLVLKLAQGGEGIGGQRGKETERQGGMLGRTFSKILGRLPGIGPIVSKSRVNPLLINLDRVKLDWRNKPFVSIHVALYNEKRVVERLIAACTNQEWYQAPPIKPIKADYAESVKSAINQSNQRGGVANYEVVIADDSTDETTEIAKQTLISADWKLINADSRGSAQIGHNPRSSAENEVELFTFTKIGGPTVKLLHRASREGFKGGALQKALLNTDLLADYICVFDADFVPYPDTVEQFVKSFQEICGGLDKVKQSNIAAVQGYQWHVLNKSQTWVTRAVRTEYAGSYVIERAGEEIYGGLKQIAGSVYAIRADILRQFGWGTSITEDFQLTLRLYEAGYKVAFTPYIQAPAEAVSTIRRLIRQRMRWAEGASFNVKCMLPRLLKSPKLTTAEKLEFLYSAPYYLQAAFFVIGTLAWFLSEAVFHAQLPFWTAALGWSLVFTNMLALPLMNIVGLFLEESEEWDYAGVISFIFLSYIVVPFQAYAAVKGFLETQEGPWFRTPKTGVITDVVKRMGAFHLRFWPFGRPASSPIMPTGADLSIANPGLSGYSKPGLYRVDLALATVASIKPRFKLIGRGVLVLLLILTMTVNYFVLEVPESYATNIGADYGQWTDIYCVSATDCKVSYYDVTNADLRMADCDNEACSSGGDRVIDTSGTVGQYTGIYCPTTSDCKISYGDDSDGNGNVDALNMADCEDETCNTNVITEVDAFDTFNNGGRDTSIYCVSATDCKIAHYKVDDLIFVDCGDTACSTNTKTTVDSAGTTGKYTSTYCLSSTDCKVSYYDQVSGGYVGVADCDDATCSTNDLSTVDPTTDRGRYTSIWCAASTDCQISYYDATNTALMFVRCLDGVDADSYPCNAAGEITLTILDGVTNCVLTSCSTTAAVGEYTSLYCPANDDCKVSYYDATNGDLKFVDCSDANCSTGSVTVVDTGGVSQACASGSCVGQYARLYCPATDDCKISFYDVSNGDLKFADCNDATCSAPTLTTVALTVPEFIGLLIPAAPFLPRVVKYLKNRFRRRKELISSGGRFLPVNLKS